MIVNSHISVQSLLSSVRLNDSDGGNNASSQETAMDAFRECERLSLVALSDVVGRMLSSASIKRNNQNRDDKQLFDTWVQPLDGSLVDTNSSANSKPRRSRRRRDRFCRNNPSFSPYILEGSDVWCSGNSSNLSTAVLNISIRAVSSSNSSTKYDIDRQLHDVVNGFLNGLTSLLSFQTIMIHVSSVVLQHRL